MKRPSKLWEEQAQHLLNDLSVAGSAIEKERRKKKRRVSPVLPATQVESFFVRTDRAGTLSVSCAQVNGGRGV
jgi:hypothetical protein